MNFYKNARKYVSIMLIMSNFICLDTYGSILDDDLEDELIELDIEKNNSHDVDLEEITHGKVRVSARSAIAIDGSTKQILFEQNGFEAIPMASTTKIMTALVALRQGKLDDELVVSKNAASIRGSKVGYSAGEKVTLHELLFGLIFKSGNDAAITIAEGISGSIENFANVMNDYGRSLGLINSHFETPHGLDSQGHYSSAYDLALLTSLCMKDIKFREVCGEKSITRDKYNFHRDYNNINKILWKIPEANGVKTGYTGQAGKCLVSSVRYKDKDIIIVVLNCADRWNQTEKIFKYIEATYTFKDDSLKNIVKDKLEIEEILQTSDINYGFKEEDKLEVEVFNPIADIKKGDTLLKFSVKDTGNIMLKKGLKSGVDLTNSEFNKLILSDN